MLEKTYEKMRAKELRANGKSLGAIAKELNVSKGSVSLWVRDVNLSIEQKKKLDSNSKIYRHYRSPESRRKAIHSFINNHRNKRLEFQEKGRVLARENNKLHLMGCMLYWTEGTKSKNELKFSNTDIDMILLFLKFLYECYGVDKRKLKCRVGSVPIQRIKKAEQFWSITTGIPLELFQKALIDKRERKIGKYARKPKHVFGVLHIRLGRTDIVQSIFGAIQEYGNFVRHDWVDKQ